MNDYKLYGFNSEEEYEQAIAEEQKAEEERQAEKEYEEEYWRKEYKKRKKPKKIVLNIKISKETAIKLVNGEGKEELLQGITDYLKEMGIEKENE